MHNKTNKQIHSNSTTKRVGLFSHNRTMLTKQNRNQTSIQPESDRLLISIPIGLHKVVEEAPPSLPIHHNMPSILTKLHRRLSGKAHHQVVRRQPISMQQHQHHHSDQHRQHRPAPPHASIAKNWVSHNAWKWDHRGGVLGACHCTHARVYDK